ncbi:MAG TPA: branched-chain amino acid ABC transporter permease [Gaiellaceae bacterium]|nr:branched-chain amino acid ABC transporter permease [Gaiellaceae bacterium]
MSDTRRVGVVLQGAARAWPVIPPMALTAAVTAIASEGNEYIHSILIIGLVNLLFVIGLYSFAGVSGVFSFGHIAFAAIGAYAAGIFAIPPATKAELFASMPSGLVHLHASAFTSTLIGGAIAACAGAITSVPLMRLGGLAASLATFAILIIVHTAAQNLNQVTNGLSGMASVPTTTTAPKVLGWCLVSMVVVFAFQESRWGLRLRASREDEVAARACGIGVYKERRAAWILSAFIMGIGGALYGQFLGTFDADAFYLDISFMVIAMLVIGGRNSLAGAVIGSICISLLAEGLRHVESGPHVWFIHVPGRPGIAALGLSAVMVAILILRPNGITGGREISWPFARLGRRSLTSTETRTPVAVVGRSAQRGDA